MLNVAVVRDGVWNPIFLISPTSEEHSTSSQLNKIISQLRYYYTTDASGFRVKNWIRFVEMSSSVKDQTIH